MVKKRSLIINTPWYYPQAHKTIIALFTHPNYHSLLDKVIFMGSAAPLGALQPSSLIKSYLSNQQVSKAKGYSQVHSLSSSCDQNYGNGLGYEQSNGQTKGQEEAQESWPSIFSINEESLKLLDDCAVRYRQWAQSEGILLLVCGMAAKRFYQDNKLSSCDGLELTGYMEVLSLINGSREDVLIW